MLNVASILDLHRKAVERWHETDQSDGPADPFLALVIRQHRSNYQLWHEEDKARDPSATAEQIAQVKRAIDRLNQERNDGIEKLDDALVAELQRQGVTPPAAASLNTETPGSAIDRLSILSLRIYHMEEQAARADANEGHREKASNRLKILREQLADLSQSLAELAADIFAGRKRLKVYRQFKMYNDPTLNPQIYKQNEKS